MPQTRFADEIYRRRTELCLTQDDIAERTDLSVTYIRTLERGGANPSFSSMVALAGAFGLTLRELLESMDRRGPTTSEAARLFDAAPEAIQKSLLDLLRSSAPPDEPTTTTKGRRRAR